MAVTIKFKITSSFQNFKSSSNDKMFKLCDSITFCICLNTDLDCCLARSFTQGPHSHNYFND